MRLLEHVPESTMVAAFLKDEYSSDRFSNELKQSMLKRDASSTIVTHPNLQNAHENQLRAEILGDYRGYRQNREIFTDFPDDLKWYKAELMPADISGLRYVNYSYWNELTNNTRLVEDAVTNIKNGKEVFGVSNDRFLSFADSIRKGKHNFGPIIIWGQNNHSPLEILEGHVRATAIALAGAQGPAAVTAIVGLHP